MAGKIRMTQIKNKKIVLINDYEVSIDNQDYIKDFKLITVDLESFNFHDSFSFSEKFDEDNDEEFHSLSDLMQFKKPYYIDDEDYCWKSITDSLKIRKVPKHSLSIDGMGQLSNKNTFIGFSIDNQQFDLNHKKHICMNIRSTDEKKIATLFEMDAKLILDAEMDFQCLKKINQKIQENPKCAIRVSFYVLCYTNSIDDSFREPCSPRTFYYDRGGYSKAYLESIELIDTQIKEKVQFLNNISSEQKSEEIESNQNSENFKHQADLYTDRKIVLLERKLKFMTFLNWFAIIASLCALVIH